MNEMEKPLGKRIDTLEKSVRRIANAIDNEIPKLEKELAALKKQKTKKLNVKKR